MARNTNNQLNDEAVEQRKQFCTSEMQKMRQQFVNVKSIFQQNELSMMQT